MQASDNKEAVNGATQTVDVVVVGAGFAGMYMLHRLRGMGFTVRVFETGSGVGGTWYWNRYPGARCDVESMQYSFQFSPELQQDWEWTERYAPQPEILAYANHVADRFDLKRDIRFNTRVTAAHYDEGTARWTVTTDQGDRVSAGFVVMATGCLSASNKPGIKGIDSFKGATYHTGHWPHEGVDFSDQRVAVIGTGSSAIQSIPIVAEQAKHLYVFQRTPNYTVPARNRPLDPEYKRAVKADYPAMRARAKTLPAGIDLRINMRSALGVSEEERQQEFERRWAEGGIPFMGSYIDLLLKAEANELAANFVRDKIRAIVKDPKVAELLSPKNVIGCKRLCVDTDYYATFNRPNVTLVDVSETPIEEITPTGLRVAGRDYEVDAIVFATGFDAMTGALLRIDIRGRGGRPLKDKWAEGPRSYLGLTIAGFPNLFTITGPGSPSVLTNMLPSIEQHVEWIADCLAHLRAQGRRELEATVDAEEAWVGHVREVAGVTLRSTCSSWYVGANIPGKPRIFMPYIGGFPAYVQKCQDVVANGYEGFAVA
ncbi:flavin-containing monooxygenase [Desertibaculum subflavum]|uniref:flavin-containing monooxygenase n=1 Tax=Desertibaculum subflavum TaxID=2268458 RepID=UPI000E6743AC